MFEQIQTKSTLHKVVLSIGSNINNPKQNIINALHEIERSNLLKVSKVSSFYLTEPNGYKTSNWFWNVSATVWTDLDPFLLLFFLKSIEYHFGRQKQDRLADRDIDIDILLYDSKLMDSKYLQLPHPKLHKRKFVLIPTIEIEPNLIHPYLNKTLETLLEECKDTLKVIKQ